MAPGHFGGVAGVTNHHLGGVVDEMFELQNIGFVGASEPHSRQPTAVVNAGMKLEAVVPSLPVLAEGGHTSGHLMSVGTNEPADWQYCAVDKAQWGCAL